MKFKDLKFEDCFDGVQAYVNTRNGYEISVVRHGGSYGNEKGLYEMGVFNAAGSMCDPLCWGDDVKGWLKPEDVECYIHQIEKV